jgi:hypothetical protein
MFILSLDPGIANTGYTLSTGACGTFITKANTPLSSRIFATCKSICDLLPKTPDLVVVEDTFGNMMKPTTMLLGGLMARLDTKFLLIPPGKWVRELFGREHQGNYKAQAIKKAKELGFKFDTQHAADAASLLEWYYQHGQENYRSSKPTTKRSNARRSKSRRKHGRL